MINWRAWCWINARLDLQRHRIISSPLLWEMLAVLRTLTPSQQTWRRQYSLLPLPVLPVLHQKDKSFGNIRSLLQKSMLVLPAPHHHKEEQIARWLTITISTFSIIFILYCLKYHSKPSITYFPDVDMPFVINHRTVSSVLQACISSHRKKGPQLNRPGLYIIKTRH